MNAPTCRTSLIAVAAAGALAAATAFAGAQTPTPTHAKTRAPQSFVKFRGGDISPSPTGSTSAVACPDAMRAAALSSAPRPFNAAAPRPVFVVPASAFEPGQFSSEARNATAHAQLARACAK